MSMYSVLGIAFGILLIYLLYIKYSVNKNQINYDENIEMDVTDFETVEEKPPVIGKNKWLYTTDDFGKMEEGVADYETREKYKRRHL